MLSAPKAVRKRRSNDLMVTFLLLGRYRLAVVVDIQLMILLCEQ